MNKYIKIDDAIKFHKVCERCTDSYTYQMPGMVGRKFLGCNYPPYNGKWVVEIEKCPRGKWGKKG